MELIIKWILESKEKRLYIYYGIVEGKGMNNLVLLESLIIYMLLNYIIWSVYNNLVVLWFILWVLGYVYW